MSDTSTELLTLPPQLIEAVRDLLVADVGLPEDLRRDLAGASEAAKSLSTSSLTNSEDASADDDPTGRTIPLDVVERLSRWSSTPEGTVLLKRGGLDPPRYSLISLLAGTEVYMPRAKRERLLASFNPDQPNPYLPSYLSPKPPSLGQEVRAMASQLTTILNVLFSIGGSGAAVYVASVTGAGYRRETAILLGLLAAIVVGIADGVLIWIYSVRLEKGRAESRKRAQEIIQGSAAIAAPPDAASDYALEPVIPPPADADDSRLRKRVTRKIAS